VQVRDEVASEDTELAAFTHVIWRETPRVEATQAPGAVWLLGDAAEVASLAAALGLRGHQVVTGDDPRRGPGDGLTIVHVDVFAEVADEAGAARSNAVLVHARERLTHAVANGLADRVLIVTRLSQAVLPGDVPRPWGAVTAGLAAGLGALRSGVSVAVLDLDDLGRWRTSWQTSSVRRC